MKAKSSLLILTAVSVSLFFTSCQKDSSSGGNEDFTQEASTHNDDASRVSAEIDAAAGDADLVLESTAGFTARDPQSIICDASVAVDTMTNPRTITITYNGTNCLGDRTRTGVIVISMAQGVRWKNAGAAVSINFQNFKITRVSDNKSITINGTKTYTNVSGGLLLNLATLGTITHTITSSNMSITFDNNSQRTWQIARQHVFTYNNGVVITTTGTHTEGNITGVAEWGTNRFGRAFTTSITTPVVIRQSCNFRITAGKVTHVVPAFTSSATFGLDASGNATTCPAGTFYAKLEWTGPAGNTHSTLIPY
jgi:hypothetical protein